MKKPTFEKPAGLALALVLGGVLPSSGQSILANGGFENGSGTDAANWEELGAGANTTVGRSESEAFEGTARAYMTVDNTTTAAGVAVFMQQVTAANTLDNTATYEFSFSAKADSTDFTGMDMFAQVQWLDQDASHGGGVVAETFVSLVGQGLTTDYQQFVFSDLDPTGNADSVLVRFQLSAGAVSGIVNGLSVDSVSLSSNGGGASIPVSIGKGTVVTWTPENEGNLYQPQKSADGETWVDFGPAFTGTTTNAAVDSEGPASFYRVLESGVIMTEAILNGGFETPDPSDPLCGANWLCLSPTAVDNFDYLPTRLNSIDSPSIVPHSGTACMQLKVVNTDEPLPTKSLILQNVVAQGGSITPGANYRFSFWAKQISSGVSYVQGYALKWLDDQGAIISESGFTTFTGGNGEWVEISLPEQQAPANAATAFLEMSAETGAIAGSSAQGEVLVDDISLLETSPGATTELAAESAEGWILSWDSVLDCNYRVTSSLDLAEFTVMVPSVTGTGGELSVSDDTAALAKFYRVEKL